MQRRGGSGQPVKGQSASKPKAGKGPAAHASTADLQGQLDCRTRERDEALEQQRATSEVLSVIARSGSNAQPVFEIIARSAARLCDALACHVFRFDGELIHLAATYGYSGEAIEALRRVYPIRPGRESAAARAIHSGTVEQIPDIQTDPDYAHRDTAKIVNFRSTVAVPMMKAGKPVGAIAMARPQTGYFPERQLELLRSFADQAVIAIENARLFNETKEALEQQTATSEVLKVISSSAGELQPVFETMLAKAVELCEASFGAMWLVEGEGYRTAALHGDLPEAYVEQWRSGTLHRPKADVPMVRAIRSRKPVHVTDMLKDTAYLEGDPLPVSVVEIAGIRTLLTVPMLKEDEAVGVITIYRKEVRAFSDKQIELVSNFAAQAVIAIENTRLLNELRQRTDDLSEALEQQTATSEVLGVISSSPGELEPVFDAMLANATRICEAAFGNLFLHEGPNFRAVAIHNKKSFDEYLRRNTVLDLRDNPGVPLDRVARTKQVVHIPDLRADQSYLGKNQFFVALVEVVGARTFVSVPMLKEGELIGAINMYRQEVRPFTDKQIELVKNFAAQAVIAIENARLLSELRESLQQQTATADVLKVISSSPGELEPVFETMLANATQICGAEFGLLYRSEGDMFRTVSLYGAPPAFAEQRRLNPMLRPSPGTALGRVAATKEMVQIPDVQAEPAYQNDPLRRASFLDLAGARTVVCVPMLKDNEVVGAISIYRQQVRPFTDKQIALLTNFAAQAVIAIENVRLLNELRQSLQQQTATADVLKVISRSTFDLQTVLQTLVESAARFCDADKATIIREKEGALYRAEAYGFSREFMGYVKNIPIEVKRGSAAGRALLEGRVVHIADVKADPEYTLVEAQKLGDYRTILCVPMLREGVPIGVLALTRSEVRPFTDRQIELVTTFADQAAIAIENVRLFESVEARTRELAASLEDLRTAQDRLVQTEKLASLGQLTAGIAHEIKNPLNFVNNFSGVSTELIDELQDILNHISIDHKARAEIKELTDTLRGNLDKVVQHGKRADAIVKNMLLHSREGSGEHRIVDINTLVEESLNLAWHGARAEKQGFDITLERSFDPTAGEVDLFPQDITRALLNLISNGFYAAIQRKAETNGGDYVPTLAASTKSLGDRVEIRIRDNGAGISAEVKEKMFNPFFTTKPAGEGTGLGLSISHDIIVKQHAGSIEVDTQPGEFTEIRITLPRAAVLLSTAP